MTDNCEAQSDEVLALASIYDGSVFTAMEEKGLRGGQFVANLQLPEGFQVICKLQGDEKPSKIHTVEHLPPVTLNFRLPLDYPSDSPPDFTLSCKWLSREQLTLLCKRLDTIWEENRGEVVLFHWFQFLADETLQTLNIGDILDVSFTLPKPKSNTRIPLQEKDKNNSVEDDNEKQSEAISKFDTASLRPRYPERTNWGNRSRGYRNYRPRGQQFPRKFTERNWDVFGESSKGSAKEARNSKQDPRAIQELPSDTNLLPIVLDYDQQRRQQVFNSNVFACNICFDEKLGSQCFAFKTCDHVFCRSCIQTFFEVQISSGNVQKLNCPEDKCSSQALPTQVRELVSSELYAKYDSMLLSSTLDTMSDIVYCPRNSCQCAVLVEPDSTMANCPACFHSFCILCKMAYHGVVPCRIKAGDFQLLCNEYLKASDEEKKLMEKRYGRAQLRTMVNNLLSEEWVQTNSKRCPHCNTPIEKRDGCNKMTCFRCDCYFCWLCMMKLNKMDPYSHYNSPSSPCVNLLFEGTVGDESGDEGADDEEFGGFL